MPALFDLLSRRPKPQRPIPPVPKDTVGERLAAEVDEIATEYNVPGWFAEYFKTDLKDAFALRGAYRPGYEPSAVAPVAVNLIDLVTDPIGTAKKLGQTVADVSKWNDLIPTIKPLQEVGITKAEGALWKSLCNTQWAGAVPVSLQHALSLWGESASRYALRIVKETQLKNCPGLALMMGQELQKLGVTHVAGVPIGSILTEAHKAEVLQAVPAYIRGDGSQVAVAGMAGCLNAASQAAELGRWKEAEYFWGQAERIQSQWTGSYGGSQQELIKEFGRQMRLNPHLANTAAGQLWRYWQVRNYRYMTLNFLHAWRKGGLKGVLYNYAWAKVTKRLGLWYPPEFISRKIFAPLLKPLLTKLTAWRAAMDRLRKKLITEPFKKAVRWLIGKLGLKALGTKIGALIGTAGTPIGTVIGAIVGAIAGFLLELVIDKLGGVLKITLGVVIGAFALVFGFLVMGALLFIILVTLIFNVNASFPGEAGPGFTDGGPLAPPSVVTVTKEACEGSGCTAFERFLKLSLRDAPYRVRWRITLTNTDEVAHSGTFSDEACLRGSTPYDLGPGESEEFFCEQTIDGSEDRLVINHVNGTVDGESPFRGVGVVMIGSPGACVVPNVPYYCQCGQPYSNVSCKGGGQYLTVCTYGCGPTSEAMLINYHCGSEVTGPGELARDYGCGAVTRGATADILGGNLSTGSFRAGDDFFLAIYEKLCEGRPVITIVKHPEVNVRHISLIVGVDMARKVVYLNDSYIPCRIDGLVDGYAEYSFDTYRRWVDTSNYWYWGGALRPACNR